MAHKKKKEDLEEEGEGVEFEKPANLEIEDLKAIRRYIG